MNTRFSFWPHAQNEQEWMETFCAFEIHNYSPRISSHEDCCWAINLRRLTSTPRKWSFFLSNVISFLTSILSNKLLPGARREFWFFLILLFSLYFFLRRATETITPSSGTELIGFGKITRSECYLNMDRVKYYGWLSGGGKINCSNVCEREGVCACVWGIYCIRSSMRLINQLRKDAFYQCACEK